MPAPELTRAQRDLLQRLRFRATMRPEQCWLVPVQRARYALIVPTMMGTHEPLMRFASATLRGLQRQGLVTYSEPGPVPPGPLRAIRVVAPNATRAGTLELTEAGEAALQPRPRKVRGA